MKKRDLNGVRGIKDEGQRVSVKEQEIKQRWKNYFDKHFNRNGIKILKKRKRKWYKRLERFMQPDGGQKLQIFFKES